MIVRLLHIRGCFRFVAYDSNGDGLPVIERRGTYRRSIFPSPNPAGSAVRAAAWSTERRAA